MDLPSSLHHTFPVFLFVAFNLLNSPRMTAPIKLRLEPNFDNRPCLFCRQGICREHDYIGIVMAPGKFGVFSGIAQGGPDALDFVGTSRHPDPRLACQNPLSSLPFIDSRGK